MKAHPPCILYKQTIKSAQQHLEQTISQAIDRSTHTNIVVFFRADDIANHSKNFSLMIKSFIESSMPLCLATVPSWLTSKKLITLQNSTGINNAQFCWHQHGWLHKNHEQTGKKYEFGASRTKHEVMQDLKKGKNRLEEFFGDEFSPFFTPPWNRCSQDTIDSLIELGFSGISRSRNAKPETTSSFPDIHINVDLHTRKENDFQTAFDNFLQELENAIITGQVGIMLHHQLMNKHAHAFLNILVTTLSSYKSFSFKTFPEI